MADTTIKVDSMVRDRLAVIAAQRGTTIRDMVTQLANATPTREELDDRGRAATAYIRKNLCPDLTDDDLVAGELFWQELRAGRIPTSLSDLTPQQSSPR